MPSSYQPRRGGLIEVVATQAASDLTADTAAQREEEAQPEEKFIDEYLQRNSKRIQSASSSITTASTSVSRNDDQAEQQEPLNNQRPGSRRASARRLFEIKEWDEQQKRLKQKLQPRDTNTNSSYNEIKATTKELSQDYDQMVNRHDFEATRRREFIYRNYCFNVREPFQLAKVKQCERLEKTRANRNRFNTQKYNQFLEFLNKRRYIIRDDYDKDEYDAFAQYENKPDEIHTRYLTDPTLLPYRKWMNERRTVSSLGPRPRPLPADDPRRITTEQDFRYYHRARTTTPHFDGRESQSTFSWQTHDQSVIDSSVRRIASAKCYYIVQQSADSITCDPIDPSLSYLRPRSSSASSAVPTRNCTPVPT